MFQTLHGGPQAVKMLEAEGGERFAMLGIEITPKVTAADSNGAFSLIEQRVMPQAGSPPHICYGEDKTIYVVEGEFEVLAGDAPSRVAAGGMVYIPRGVIHNFRNVGPEPGMLLVAVTPGGHEGFLRRLSEIVNGSRPDPELLADVCRAHSVEMII
jgi:quercetin dioxygenase-like cupin family protein